MTPLLVALCVVLLDQISKEWVRGSFTLHESVTVIPGFFDLTYIRNTGAAWGMFSNYTWALSLLAVIMLVLLVVFRRRIMPPGLLNRFSLGLLCGGIAGNLLDRVRLDYVTDFLDLYVGSWHWPAFNIADSAICIGVGLYILASLRTGPDAPAAPPADLPAP